MSETCALDVAGNGPQNFDRTGELLNVTRERVRQIEAMALAKLLSIDTLRDLDE
jgi:DNA-directed RNA polymerase sigma subunit (sigma70/sigma32)